MIDLFQLDNELVLYLIFFISKKNLEKYLHKK